LHPPGDVEVRGLSARSSSLGWETIGYRLSLHCSMATKNTGPLDMRLRKQLIVTTLCGFALGLAGNLIFALSRDSHIKDRDRQSKTLAFWKTLEEAKAG
jgi:hypothetical protein